MADTITVPAVDPTGGRWVRGAIPTDAYLAEADAEAKRVVEAELIRIKRRRRRSRASFFVIKRARRA